MMCSSIRSSVRKASFRSAPPPPPPRPSERGNSPPPSSLRSFVPAFLRSFDPLHVAPPSCLAPRESRWGGEAYRDPSGGGTTVACLRTCATGRTTSRHMTRTDTSVISRSTPNASATPPPRPLRRPAESSCRRAACRPAEQTATYRYRPLHTCGGGGVPQLREICYIPLHTITPVAAGACLNRERCDRRAQIAQIRIRKGLCRWKHGAGRRPRREQAPTKSHATPGM